MKLIQRSIFVLSCFFVVSQGHASWFEDLFSRKGEETWAERRAKRKKKEKEEEQAKPDGIRTMIIDGRLHTYRTDHAPFDVGADVAQALKDRMSCEAPETASPGKYIAARYTPVNSLFWLERPQGNSFRVGIPVWLLADPDENLPDSISQELVPFMSRRIQGCLAYLNQGMRGPAGEKLEFFLIEKGSGHSFPEPPFYHKIELGHKLDCRDGGCHIHSGKYPRSISCNTIMHELMHLLGFVDEYGPAGYMVKLSGQDKFSFMWTQPTDQQIQEAYQAYDCRAIGPIHSLMTASAYAITPVFGDFYEKKTCLCTTQKCRRALAGWTKGSCPPGSRTVAEVYDPEFGEEMRNGVVSINQREGTITVRRGAEALANRSLLLPAQFRALTRPGCEENYHFYLCSNNYYATSKSNGGNGCTVDPVPSVCSNGNRDWVK